MTEPRLAVMADDAIANILTYGIGRGPKKLSYARPPHEAPAALT
jgi:hypothetical protein